ncbi:hypothetical protein QWJ34_21075 [Saccharibacillus sp. CPCC 101409]|uniref:hypothetical protein n=1 Tax=Saccharibacillus sp. CPCC 101409 TaxID=3058041 RepID=UPI0026717D93|nr:hypothetical protein [Saccharibacillus sp. CPCC 101409]MDO3412270.1 hypothetical protein [Saccharibacillus sp. CPCC 101409]
MKDEKFDELFDEAFERAVRSSSPVDEESRRAAWQRVQQHRRQQSSRLRRKRTIRLTASAAGFILLGSIAFSEPVRTGALSPIYQKLQNWGDGSQTVTIDNQVAKDPSLALTAPPPDSTMDPSNPSNQNDLDKHMISYVEKEVSLEEARSRLAFVLPDLTDISEQFEFEKVVLMVPDPDDGSKARTVFLYYASGNGELMDIMIRWIAPNSTSGMVFGGPVTEVNLKNEQLAHFVDMDDNPNFIEFVYNNMDIQISGKLSQKELVELANHMID